MRRATELILLCNQLIHYFNPRSPWGERRNTIRCCFWWFRISIHALREESDLFWFGKIWFNVQFQSTLSVRRATEPLSDKSKRGKISIHALREESDKVNYVMYFGWCISIHALREESDCCWLRWYAWFYNFNPRSPWGERPLSLIGGLYLHNFNPRSPWGERRKF